MPIRLGQELEAYAGSLRRGLKRVIDAADYLRDLGIGGSAVGTGVNVEPEYPALMVKYLRASTGLDLREGEDRIQLMQSMGDVAGFSAQIKVLAVDLSKIASDLRLLASGPRTGLDEIRLPAVQPGSSIMPGKINPSIPEMVNQVCFQVFGNDACVAAAAEHGQLELNVMMPVIAWNALHASTILREAIKTLRSRTIDGIEADEARARELLDRSTAMATALSPYIGYAATADVAKDAVKTGRSVREVVLERNLLDAAQLDDILSAEAMTRGGIIGAGQVGRVGRVGEKK
jgi:aspartate ammonia-lyase